MKTWTHWIALTALAAASGCTGTPGTGSYSAPLCRDDSSCAGTASCVRGICHDACATDADCPAGAVCSGALCWASTSGSCTSDADCAAGEACTAGTCAVPPAPIACRADADCPAGARCDGGSCVTAPAEICGNGLDDDLDGLIDEDCGGACTADADCAAGETCLRGVCSATATDADGDGYPSTSDCDDSDASVNPGATELCNRVDDNCDGVVDEGCGGSTTCRSDADCAPAETCLRGTCSGSAGTDADGDGFPSTSDCDDTNPGVYPGAAESCDGLDNNCDGVIDEGCGGTTTCRTDSDCAAGESCVSGTCTSSTGTDADGDGYPATTDCDDADPSVHPGAAETCDGRDNDCNGIVDDGCGTACRTDADCGPAQSCLRGYCY